MHHRSGHSMLRMKPRIDILPAAQREIWPQLAAARDQALVLYGGTAVALHLGHRVSVDFDFFSSRPLDKARVRSSFAFMRGATILQDSENTLVVITSMPAGPVKLSFFGGMSIGRLNDPLETEDSALLVASLEDLLATKLKTILNRIEAKDYRDISAMISAGVSLERGLAAFAQMYGNDPAHPLKAMGYFRGGDLASLPQSDRDVLCAARDRVKDIPSIVLVQGLCP
jgi:hypothetical protein